MNNINATQPTPSGTVSACLTVEASFLCLKIVTGALGG